MFEKGHGFSESTHFIILSFSELYLYCICTFQEKHEKELLQLQQEVDKERAQLQETEMSMIRNLQEAMDLSTKRMQITKKKVAATNIVAFLSTYINWLTQ